MWYCLVFLIGFILSGVCFCSSLLFQRFCIKEKIYWLQGMSMVIVSLIPTIAICAIFCTQPFHFLSLLNWKSWLLAIVTVIFTILLIYLKHDSYDDEPIFILCIEAACMEIPQRVMMQTFICNLLAMHHKQEIWGILINALIWCASILVQAFITKQINIKSLMLELVASFVFSMGIGYVFYSSQCLVIPMLSHAAERVVTRKYNLRKQ